MKLFIVALKGLDHPVMPQFARDALRCATLFSGMEVVPLTDYGEPGWLDARPYMDRASRFRERFKEVCGMEVRELPALLRWFIIEEYIRVHDLKAPIMQIDWEILVFGDLAAHCRSLSVEGGAFGDMLNHELTAHNRTAPYWINDLSAIGFFTSLLEAHARHRTPLMVGHKCGGDMNWWEHARDEGCYTPVDLSREWNGAVFDLNVMLEKSTYEFNGEAKSIYWVDGVPHFRRNLDGGLVRVVGLHCFWTWKQKTSDILAKSEAKYTGT